jgi:hypothetical protein
MNQTPTTVPTMIDISNPSAPSEVGYYDTLGTASAVVVGQGCAYTADLSGGLTMLWHYQHKVYLPLVMRNY